MEVLLASLTHGIVGGTFSAVWDLAIAPDWVVVLAVLR